jgi:type I restriction enzyme S subunit
VSGWRETEYGCAPSEWKTVTIREISEKVTDGSHFSPKPCSSGKYMCSVKDMTYDRFDFSSCKLISPEDFEKLKLQGCQPQKGDILISKDGANCLDLIFVFSQDEDIVLLSSIAIIRLLSDYNSVFVRYFLLSPTCQFTMRNNYISGSAIPRVVLKDFKKIPILLPPLPEQRAIAAVLSSLDDKIDLLHRQNKTLEAMAETLFRQWFVEEAKEDWEDVPFMEFFDFLEGPGIRNWQYKESGTPFINIRLISDGDIDVSKANFVSDKEANEKYRHFHLKEGDMIVSTSGTLGKNAIVRSYHLPLLLNTSVIRFRPQDGRSHSFVYQYLKSRLFQEHLESTASGSVQANFGPTHLKQMILSKPPQEVLDQYLQQADQCYEKLKANQAQIKTLEKLRDTLLPKLMSGEVRVAL